MNITQKSVALAPGESVPEELLALQEQIDLLPPEIRQELAPSIAEAIEQARFRSRVLLVAREALERLRLELEMTRFDLEITRREREDWKLRAH